MAPITKAYIDTLQKPGRVYAPYLLVAIEAAQKAGKYILDSRTARSSLKIDRKENRNDYVTEVDRTSERMIIEHITSAFPEHSFLAEESGYSENRDQYRWIIDPLDGTTNYLNGLPLWAVSIGLEYNNELITGVVYAPELGDIYYAVKGGGAFLNGLQIHVREIEDFSEALLLTGFPFKAQTHLDVYLQTFKVLFKQCSGMRRAGSASIDLSWVAAGKAAGFWEISLGPWDIAAGTLLVREAGGIVTDIHGDPDDFMRTGNVVAGGMKVHAKILEATKKYLRINL
ncbi:MAG: inositol monophosphatase [Acidobacteria bacterium]|nr:inositol monophosphatase [Acidobacteriota bacterium]